MLRVATFNIRHAAPLGRPQMAQLRPFVDGPTMAATVAGLGADVVALQEVDWRTGRSWFRNQARLAGSGAGLHHLDAPARSRGWFGRYGNALLYRGHVLDADIVVLPTTGEARNALFARVDLGSVTATLVATHLQNPTRRSPGDATRQLEAILGRLGAWPEPWVLMGDLNLGPDEVLPRFSAAGLDAVDGPPTFPSDEPTRRIDWIGVRGAEAVAVEVPEVLASDHRPLVADLAFGRGGEPTDSSAR